MSFFQLHKFATRPFYFVRYASTETNGHSSLGKENDSTFFFSLTDIICQSTILINILLDLLEYLAKNAPDIGVVITIGGGLCTVTNYMVKWNIEPIAKIGKDFNDCLLVCIQNSLTIYLIFKPSKLDTLINEWTALKNTLINKWMALKNK